MKTKLFKSLTGVLLLITILLIPYFFKGKNQIKLSGPDLSELKYSEIFYNNYPDSLMLSGMLFLPEGQGPFPTAILIHGSGPSKRNSPWYLSVTKHLQESGIAVLLPDKRGCEKSEGKWIGASFEDLSSDVISSIGFVKNQSIYKSNDIGIIGMSQGGWIAPVVATKSKDISFVICMSGAVVTTDDQLLYEEINNIAPYTYTFIARLVAPLTSNNLKKKDFFAPIAGFDPVPYLKKISIPLFYAFGENDKNVPVEQSIARLKENNLNDFKVKVYPDGGHAIIDLKTNKVNELFLNDLVEFIRQKNPK
jgi:dipeptidyl aminopeptidase/acylaminoacyl peptidase